MMANGNTLLRVAVCAALMLLFGNALARDVVKGQEVYFDTEETTERDNEMGNPFNVLVLMYNLEPVVDSKSEPHDHGHLIQWIVDGGNGAQDPPNADGSPGGDDSLAFGNYNQLLVGGQNYPPVMEGKTGTFAPVKYFIPYQDDRVYYLRLWEGGDARKAPYYQDTSEYVSTIGDQGGGMVRLSSRVYTSPQDITWKFGPSKARPQK